MLKTDLQRWLHEGLFEQVPVNIAIIDKDFNLVEANQNFYRLFGRWKNKKCYEVYKGASKPCKNCMAVETFKDGKERVSDEVGLNKSGKKSHYVVHIAPIKSRRKEEDEIPFVIEMSTDVTETKQWQREYQLLFDRVPCYVHILDRDFKIVRANQKQRDIFGDNRGKYCYEVFKHRKTKCENCPAERTFRDGLTHTNEQEGLTKDGETINYMVTTTPLSRPGEETAYVIEMSTDLTQLKKLEREKIEAERLAAVGQTVAGLAHSVKNMLMGLEGGMYMVRTGLKKSNNERIVEGWEILERNFEKTTSLVRDFLSFSKGRLPSVKMVNPNELVIEIVELYQDAAQQQGIYLETDLQEKISPVFLDPDGLHTCLTNLVSNAIDACNMSSHKGCKVLMRTKDIDGTLFFEVSDNGSGMDYELKKKIFTSFFTTKGGEGTGLGLLTTRKIVQEHGGKIVVESEPGKGSKFRIELPKDRLPTPEIIENLISEN